ncbi:MAG: hypothetical protein FGM33_06555 [Candidatus Kapabacteria bacterium]|nr:hypothetical protein [Candidatus Kapabacteria bacterium]
MKNLYLLALIMVISGCSTVIHQHNLACHNRTRTQIVQSATAVLVQSGFTIKSADTVLGLIQAETPDEARIGGYLEHRVWQIMIKPRLEGHSEISSQEKESLSKPQGAASMYLFATAKSVLKGTNVFGATTGTSETYYHDGVSESWNWYWDVRRGLEEICGARCIISKRSVN